MFGKVTAPNNPEAVDEARRRIDIERAVLQASLRNLGAQRNLYAPVARLPTEVLCLIFSHYQEVSKLLHRKSLLHWIIITHICQRWREVSLQHSSLWIEIPFNSPRWALEMLQRSKGADLIAHINLYPYPKQFHPGPTSEVVRTFLENHLHRAKELVLRNATTTKLSTIFENIPLTSTPRLQVLKLMQSYYRSSATSDSIELLDKIICETNSLQELEVFHAARWDSKLFNPALTSLTINNLSMKSRPPLADFLDALARTPSLKKLRLAGVVLPEAGSKVTQPLTINLLDLEILDISDTLPEVADALSYMRYPLTCQVRLQCTMGLNPIPNLSQTMKHMREFYSRWPSTMRPHFLSCKVKLLYHPGSDVFFSIEFWPELTETTGHYPDRSILRTPSLELELTWSASETSPETTRREIRHVFNEVFGAVPSQNLTVISVMANDVSVLSSKTFLPLGQQPDLTSLHLSGPIAPAFLRFLEQRPKARQQQEGRNSPTPSPEKMIFPSLRYFDINNIEFEPPDQYPIEALKAYLSKRRNNNCGLETLCLANPANLTDEDAAGLRALVTNLHCEEVEEFF